LIEISDYIQKGGKIMKRKIIVLFVVLSFLWIQPAINVTAGTSDGPAPSTTDTPRISFSQTLKKAESGDAKAQFELGLMYAKGEEVARDKQKAIMWCTRSAEQGNPDAQLNLGIIYANGDSVPQDKRKAVAWYTKAAKQGLGEAQLNLGLCYARGEGVAMNKMVAYRWWLKAAKQGNKIAQENIDLLCRQNPRACK
jgi:TPR repeat protein